MNVSRPRGHVTRSRAVMPVISLLLLASLVPLSLLFATSAGAATAPNLGNAAPFAVLAGTPLISDAGAASTITGDVGLDPASGAAIGLLCSQVTGTIYEVNAGGPSCFDDVGTAAGSVLTNAVADETTAYGDLSTGSNATCTVDYGAVTQALVGLSLSPGVYCATSFTLTGTLTLTGAGPWIFVTRSGGTLVTSGTANVVGGNACSVWWKVVSSATLGTNTSLVGNVLALTSIVIQTGATLNGRALAQNGDVTLDHNTITAPNCAAPTPATPTATATSSSESCTVTSLLVASTVGQAVTFTATIVGSDPTGTVSFYDGGTTVLGSAAVNGSGEAILTVANLPAGTNLIWISYSGDGANAACQFGFFTETVTAAAITPTTTPTTPTTPAPTTPTTVAPAPVSVPSPFLTTPSIGAGRATAAAAAAAAAKRAAAKRAAATSKPTTTLPTAPTSPIVPAAVSVTG